VDFTPKDAVYLVPYPAGATSGSGSVQYYGEGEVRVGLGSNVFAITDLGTDSLVDLAVCAWVFDAGHCPPDAG
jgi:hypothetical protein